MRKNCFRIPGELKINNSQKVIVVSIIGRSSFHDNGEKLKSLGILFRRPLDPEDHVTIEGFYNEHKNVIYLHARTLFDTAHFAQFCGSAAPSSDGNDASGTAEESHSTKDITDDFNEARTTLSRALFFLLHVSHIIVLNQPGNNFDLSYVQIFKVLESCRHKYANHIEMILSDNFDGISAEWLSHRRPCTPRMLFYFESCPPAIRKSKTVYTSIKKLEHVTEDKLYDVFRKTKVITHNCSGGLFSIPLNQEYVFMNTEPTVDRMTYTMRMLIKSCQTGPSAYAEKLDFTYPTSSDTAEQHQHNLNKFLDEHIQQAVAKGFDESVVHERNSIKPYFEMPNVEFWIKVANLLYNCFVAKHPKNDAEAIINSELAQDLNVLNVDTQFSEQRCLKVLPIAFTRYQESLPPNYYSMAYHENRLNVAMAAFTNHARGPMFEKYSKKLIDNCREYFENGRQLCEILSLTGHPCVLPKHGNEHEHSSGVRYISACDCGGIQGTREDPFSMKAANFLFYQSLALDCNCQRLERVEFPVFEPSTKEFKAADLLSPTNTAVVEDAPVPDSTVNSSEETNDTNEVMTKSFGVITHYTAADATGDNSISEYAFDEQNTNKETDKTDKSSSITRQPSTTEYLPGMLTLVSPPGLLPQFQSWSLVCLGPSSLYSHNIGLTESQHPGFLSGSNFLLPWDETIVTQTKAILDARKYGGSSKGMQRKKMSQSNMGVNSANERQEVVVKIFIGAEYECPRGHRFMMSANDKVLRASGGLVKESGHKVVKSDMPLYFNCPCRTSSNKPPLVARLMRLHIVTPKNLAYVTLTPKVQLTPNSSPFIPQFDLPIQLSQSTYWVLRLPYIYVNDGEPYLPPLSVAPTSQPSAKLLQGTWKVVSCT